MSTRAVAITVAAAAALGGVALAAAAQTPAAPFPGAHDALAAAGPQAAHIGRLWNVFVGVCTAVFSAVLLALLIALRRGARRRGDDRPDLSSIGRHEGGPYRSVVAAVAVSTVLLLALIVASVVTDRALARMSQADAVHVEVTAHQWWWELQYAAQPAGNRFTTANELRVPAGRPVVLALKADDVIHSFWVPSLAGKKDLIPGRSTSLHFRADKPGVYRGQCAEFCGFQHAFMAFEVVAVPPAEYDAWVAAQRRPAAAPTGALAQRGRDVFLGSACVMCHAIEGTTAGARKAPDLTHVASRTTLAAGTLPNGAEAMRRWIRYPQQFKPGANMPPSTLDDADLDALVAYLGTLK